MKEDTVNDNTEIQRMTMITYEKWYYNKLDNLEEIDKFLEIYDFKDWIIKK